LPAAGEPDAAPALARACPFRRFRFSRSFVANLCSRAAFSSALLIGVPGRFPRNRARSAPLFRLASRNGLWHQPPAFEGRKRRPRHAAV